MSQDTAVARLDALAPDQLRAKLEACCGSREWQRAMVAARPYGTADRLFAVAERAADGMSADDWLEAFSHHPRIGDLASLRAKYSARAAAGAAASAAAGSSAGPNQHERWAQGEQSAVGVAGDAVLEALADGNARYEERFGFLFIVCATGKSAEEMLGLLRARLGNDPSDGSELAIAAGEQRKITRIRLEKLLASLAEEAS